VDGRFTFGWLVNCGREDSRSAFCFVVGGSVQCSSPADLDRFAAILHGSNDASAGCQDQIGMGWVLSFPTATSGIDDPQRD
jgi:hypothetical protein